MTDKLIQKKISQIVAAYKKRYPDDYRMVVDAVKMKRGLTRDQFASIEGSSMRGLFEIPEKLHQSLVIGLAEEEIEWFKSLTGGRWFATTFREFALPTAI